MKTSGIKRFAAVLLSAFVLSGCGDGSSPVSDSDLGWKLLFKSNFVFNTGDSPSSVVVGDFDGNSHLDMAVADYDSHDISFFLSDGDGTFSAGKYDVGKSPCSRDGHDHAARDAGEPRNQMKGGWPCALL